MNPLGDARSGAQTSQVDHEFLASAATLLATAAACYQAEHDWRRAALHDPLTGLAKRALFTDRATQALAARRRTGAPDTISP
jgi:GGDEF domain-containing protein